MREAGWVPRATKLLSPLHPPTLPISNLDPVPLFRAFLDQSYWLTKDGENRLMEREGQKKKTLNCDF